MHWRLQGSQPEEVLHLIHALPVELASVAAVDILNVVEDFLSQRGAPPLSTGCREVLQQREQVARQAAAE